MKILLLLSLLLPLLPLQVVAEEVYQTQETFIADNFANAPEKTIYQPADDLQKTVNKIMRHRYPLRPVAHWREGNKTAWVLEAIGKYKPITTGIVVNDGKIETLKVLTYRESHGWEVKYPSFTDQFKQAALKDNNKLDTHIDGISGATLSVKALTRLGQLALFYHKQVMENE